MREIAELERHGMDETEWMAECAVRVGLGTKTFEELKDGSVQAENRAQYESMKKMYYSTKNSNNVKWSKTNNEIIAMLDSETEYKVLLIFMNGASMHNILCASLEELRECTGTSNVRFVRNGVNALIEKGLIARVSPAKKNCPAKYMVNPQLRTQGNVNCKKLQALYDSFLDEDTAAASNITLRQLTTYEKKENTVEQRHYDYENVNTLRCNYLQGKADKT